MQRRSLLAIITATVIAGVVVAAIATSGTIYTWEKTFEVKEKPEIEYEIECEIEVGDCKIVGYPVKVWVCLKLDDEWENECDDDWNDDCDDDWEDECDDDWKDECDDDEDCWECCCQVNGTYSVHLYWWNETFGDWQHFMHLQEETNITLTCHKKVWTYTFVPKWEGEYKVVVTFAMDSEIYTFTNED